MGEAFTNLQFEMKLFPLWKVVSCSEYCNDGKANYQLQLIVSSCSLVPIMSISSLWGIDHSMPFRRQMILNKICKLVVDYLSFKEAGLFSFSKIFYTCKHIKYFLKRRLISMSVSKEDS